MYKELELVKTSGYHFTKGLTQNLKLTHKF